MILTPLVLAACIVFSAGSAAADTACFDWDCTSGSGMCTFDFSCSEASPFIWKYKLNFGDGTSTGLIGSTTAVHVYTLSTWAYPFVTLTLYPWSDNPFPTVTCQIIVANVIGPPMPQAGRCTE